MCDSATELLGLGVLVGAALKLARTTYDEAERCDAFAWAYAALVRSEQLGVRLFEGLSSEAASRVEIEAMRAAMLRAGCVLPRWSRGPLEGPTGERRPSFRCPVCGTRSFHPKDVEHGYCGRCHDWTGKAG